MKIVFVLLSICSLALGATPEELYQYYQARNLELLSGLLGYQGDQRPLPLALNGQNRNPSQIGVQPTQNYQQISPVSQQQSPVYQNTRQPLNSQQQQQVYQDNLQNQNTLQQRQNNVQQQQDYLNRQNQNIAQQQQSYLNTRQDQNIAQQPPNNRQNQNNLQQQGFRNVGQTPNNQQFQSPVQTVGHNQQPNPAAQGFRNINQHNNLAQPVPLGSDNGVDKTFSNRNSFIQSNANVPSPNVQQNPNYFGQNTAHRQQGINVQPLLSSGDVLALANLNLNVKQLSSSISNFGLNFLRNVGPSSQNLIFSPLSIVTILALLQQGAKGETQAELTNVLQMSPEFSASSFAKLNDNVKQRTSSRNTLELANNIFISDSFNLKRDYKRKAMKNFNSEVTPTFFTSNGDTVNFINSWVAAKTNNKIMTIVTSEDVNDYTKLVLANAVYFKGTWENKFKLEATMNKPFTLSNGQVKVVPFMRQRLGFQAGVDPNTGAQVVILPFDGKLYSLIVILPSDNSDISSVIPTLTEQTLQEYTRLPSKEVLLEIPKFTIKTDLDLAPILKKIGVQKIFTQLSDLSNMGSFQTFSPIVSSALHTAVLSIDETGGTAAASSASAAVALSYDENSMEFKVDKPFIAVLWDSKAAMPLFLARVEDPTQI